VFYEKILKKKIKNKIIKDIINVYNIRNKNGKRILLIEVGKWKKKEVYIIQILRCVFKRI
jgi:hypothetical protein